MVCESFEQPRKVYVWDLAANSATTIGNIAEANWPTPDTGRGELQPHFTPDGMYSIAWNMDLQEPSLSSPAGSVPDNMAWRRICLDVHLAQCADLNRSAADATTGDQIRCFTPQPEGFLLLVMASSLNTSNCANEADNLPYYI